MENDFDTWNTIKKSLEGTDDKKLFPRPGEVWMSYVGKNIGQEQNGGGANFSRPLLIVKKFNNTIFWSVPLSSRQKDIDFYYNFKDPADEKIAAILVQMKLISNKRLQRRLYQVPPLILIEIKEKLRQFLL